MRTDHVQMPALRQITANSIASPAILCWLGSLLALEAALFKRKNLQRKNQSDLRIKKSSVKKLTYKSLPGLTRQVDIGKV